MDSVDDRDGRSTQSWALAVVIVGPLPPPSGGMANQTRQLGALLSSEGCRVTVVQTNAAYRPAWIGKLRGVRALFRLLPYVINVWRASATADIVHVMANSGWAWHLFAAPAIWLAHIRHKPVVVNYRGGDAGAFFQRQIALIRPTLAKASQIIVPSGFLAHIFAGVGFPATIVPNVVNLSAFFRGTVRHSHPRIVVTRNLETIYDIETGIQAFAILLKRHPIATLTVVGSGPQRAELETLVNDLGISHSVTFTGRLDNADLPALYRASTVLMNPSRIDNMPNSLLEAMASGVPIVSTDVGGIPYMVENNISALLVPAGDPEAMAAALQRVCDDDALATALSRAAEEAVSDYSWRQVRGRLLSVYRVAISSRAAVRGVAS